MKKKSFLLLGTALLILSCYEPDESTIEENLVLETDLKIINEYSKGESTPIEGQYIVTLQSEVFEKIPSLKDKSFQKLNLRTRTNQKAAYKDVLDFTLNTLRDSKNISFGFDNSKIISTYSFAFNGFVAKNLTKGEIDSLRNDPRVKNITQDYEIMLSSTKPSTPRINMQQSGQQVPWGITRIGGAGNGIGKTAWVIDSGIDLDHPDLNVDISRSISFTGDGNPNDGNGHGTHVAGTIAAINNSIGVVGVAAGADVVALKVLGDDGRGQFSWTIQALDYVSAIGSSGDVANMSLGPDSRYTDPSTDQATENLSNQDIKVTIAAGNSYDDSSFYSPARVNASNVYTISGIGEGDLWYEWSNYGSPVDFAAPGRIVLSTVPGGYASLSGTSMAAPHAAGVLLLGNPSTDGRVIGAYYEVRGRRFTGNVSANNIFRRSRFRDDLDGDRDYIIHR